MERWKGVGLREDQLLARLAGEGGDPKAATLARELVERSGAAERRGVAAARVAELRTQLSETSPAYAQARRRVEVSLSDITAALRPGELFLDIWVVPASDHGRKDDDRVVAALIGSDGVRAIRRLDSVGALTPFLSIENIFAVGRVAEAAYADFIAPFASEISRAERLYISADGPLHLVPFEALRTPQGRYLVEDIAIEMVRSGASLVAARRSDQVTRSGVVIADAIDYGRGPKGETPARPLAGKEGTAIAEVMRSASFGSVTLVGGRDASKSWLLGLAAPRILHLSTHGFYQGSVSGSDNPLALAAIALAGANEDSGRGNSGMLTAAEAMGLKLDGSDLVVLSACETARGGATYAEGLAGLPSALAIAGARRTLLALWPVDDLGTTAFMRRFYEHLVATPDDYAAALRATKLDAIAGRIDDPARSQDWKAFVLIRN